MGGRLKNQQRGDKAQRDKKRTNWIITNSLEGGKTIGLKRGLKTSNTPKFPWDVRHSNRRARSKEGIKRKKNFIGKKRKYHRVSKREKRILPSYL